MDSNRFADDHNNSLVKLTMNGGSIDLLAGKCCLNFTSPESPQKLVFLIIQPLQLHDNRPASKWMRKLNFLQRN